MSDQVRSDELRVAGDGYPYEWSDFVEHYGLEAAKRAWASASSVSFASLSGVRCLPETGSMCNFHGFVEHFRKCRHEWPVYVALQRWEAAIEQHVHYHVPSQCSDTPGAKQGGDAVQHVEEQSESTQSMLHSKDRAAQHVEHKLIRQADVPREFLEFLERNARDVPWTDILIRALTSTTRIDEWYNPFDSTHGARIHLNSWGNPVELPRVATGAGHTEDKAKAEACKMGLAILLLNGPYSVVLEGSGPTSMPHFQCSAGDIRKEAEQVRNIVLGWPGGVNWGAVQPKPDVGPEIDPESVADEKLSRFLCSPYTTSEEVDREADMGDPMDVSPVQSGLQAHRERIPQSPNPNEAMLHMTEDDPSFGIDDPLFEPNPWPGQPPQPQAERQSGDSQPARDTITQQIYEMRRNLREAKRCIASSTMEAQDTITQQEGSGSGRLPKNNECSQCGVMYDFRFLSDMACMQQKGVQCNFEEQKPRNPDLMNADDFLQRMLVGYFDWKQQNQEPHNAQDQHPEGSKSMASSTKEG